MKVELIDNYFIEEKPSGFTLKQRYQGKRNGRNKECEKIISFHKTFIDASETFLRLIQSRADTNTFISLSEYINCLKSENRKAIEAIRLAHLGIDCVYIPIVKEDTSSSIVDLIPVGRDNAISRKTLISLCLANGLISDIGSDENKDRAMRKLIEKARHDYTILNLSNGRGYYRVSKDDLLDLQRYIRQEDNRARASFRNHSMARKLYEDYNAGRIDD